MSRDENPPATGAREKGVATEPCPNCGTELPLVEEPNGGQALSACPTCYSAEAAPETAAAVEKAPAREAGTTVQKES